MARRLSRERWRRAEELFGEALERPLEERGAFLDESCGSDPALRREVERLLAADGKAESFLSPPALAGNARGSDSGTAAAARPRSIGPYKLVREIGRGGMSRVWLAVRADQELRRRVAIKCLHHNMATEDLRRRMRRERQILASLDHPNIAQLYDVGTTEEGLPYLVMEYIEGEPITEFCDRHRLTIEERLELFRTVCSAVHTAHQNLVVHRDIKPSNIMVTEDGTPKLLDFGVAKWLNPELTSHHLAPTTPWQQFLTPEYASPEQILGKAVTTASDIYSLGVLLFELLTGQLPYRLTGLPLQEVERVLAEEEPASPSATAGALAPADEASPSPDPVSDARCETPPGLRRRLAGDLDNVVAMTLCKEPQRRYASAAQLAADLGRYLGGQPVLAHRPTLAYRARKFVRRHRLAVALAAGVLLLILVSAASLTVLSVRLAEQRDQAQRERDKATRVTAFLEGIFEASNPNELRGDTLTARELLDLGAAQAEKGLTDQPELQALLMAKIGHLYRQLGLYPEAERLLEGSLEHRRQLGEEAVAEGLTSLGLLRCDQGLYPEAEKLLRQALDVRRRLVGEEHPQVAQSLDHLATVLAARGRTDAAEPLARQSLEIRRQLHGEEHPEVAAGLALLGSVLLQQGEQATAEPLLRQALDTRRLLYGDIHLEVAESLSQLARLLQDSGEYLEAEESVGRALEIWRQLLGEDHPKQSQGLMQLADLASKQRDFDRAEPLYEEALQRARRGLGEDHPKLAELLAGFGQWNMFRGRPWRAEALLRRALEIHQRNLPAEHWRVAQSQAMLGSCLGEQRRFEEAEPLLLAAYRGLARHADTRPREAQTALEEVLQLYLSWRRPKLAAGYLELLIGARPSGPDIVAMVADLDRWYVPGPPLPVAPRNRPGEPSFTSSDCFGVDQLIYDVGLEVASCAAYCRHRGEVCVERCTTNRGLEQWGAEAWRTESECRAYATSGGQMRCDRDLSGYFAHFRRKYRCCCVPAD